jgi:pyrophosphatase PpaX
MKTYKYILLDWDGNLAKTLDVWLEACRVVLKNHELELTDREIGSSFGNFIGHFKAWGFDEPESVIDEAVVIAKQKLPDVELYPDAIEVLECLCDSGKKLALITTSPHENIKHLLDKYNLANFFETIIAMEDTQNHKPHPEPLEKALQQLGGNKNEAIMIGDSDKDIGAANNAKIDSILFYPPEHEKYYDISDLKSHEPTYVVNDFRQILKLV